MLKLSHRIVEVGTTKLLKKLFVAVAEPLLDWWSTKNLSETFFLFRSTTSRSHDVLLKL